MEPVSTDEAWPPPSNYQRTFHSIELKAQYTSNSSQYGMD